MFLQPWNYDFRADSKFVPSQWETALLCNDVSHWLCAGLESALPVRTCCHAMTLSNNTLKDQSWSLESNLLLWKINDISCHEITWLWYNNISNGSYRTIIIHLTNAILNWDTLTCLIFPQARPTAGLILGSHPAYERRRYYVTTTLIGWAQAWNPPCICLACMGKHSLHPSFIMFIYQSKVVHLQVIHSVKQSSEYHFAGMLP